MRKGNRFTKAKEREYIGDEPEEGTIIKNAMEYAQALRAYEYFYDRKKAKNFLLQFLENENPKLAEKISKLNEKKIPPVLGWIARMKSRNVKIAVNFDNEGRNETEVYFKQQLNILSEKYDHLKEENNASPKRKERSFDRLHDKLIAEVDHCIDNFPQSESSHIYDFAREINLTQKEISLAVEKYRLLLKEVEAIKTDPEIKEAYSHLKARQATKYKSFLEEIVEQLESLLENKKRQRKPRERKKPSIQKLFSRFKVLEEDAELKISSLAPEKLLGKNVAIFYNIKYRMLFWIESLEGFGVKSMSLTNISESKSFKIKLRNPQDVLPILRNSGKRNSLKEINSLTTRKSPIDKFKTNENTLIVRIL